METRWIVSIFGWISLLLLLGCTNVEEPQINTNEVSGGESSNENLETPPDLTISGGDEMIRTIRGTYSWNYDNGDGTSTGIEAESDPPPTIVENQNGMGVTPEDEIRLNFEVEPTHYVVNVWDTDNTVIATYDEVVISNYSGKIIYEVLAHWDQGTVSYAFSLHVKE